MDYAYLYVMDRMYALCNKLRTRCNNSDAMENELHHTCHATLAHSYAGAAECENEYCLPNITLAK